jgi:hypothetical protein
MIIILGLIILVAAGVAGVAGVLSNSGSGHALTHGFAVFGYHVTGSTGTLFLYGIVAGRPAGPQPSRRQACSRNRGTASPPPKLLPVHPPQQMTH